MKGTTFPGVYRDKHGSETIELHNDGDILRTTIRGVAFCGDDFDSLAPAADTAPDALVSFTLGAGSLCDCGLRVEIPIHISLRGSVAEGILDAKLDIGAPAANGGVEHEHLQLTLACDGSRITSPGTSGYFESELREIQKQLPEDIYLKTCFNCLYADYSPYGYGLFGSMLCFRNIKNEYLQVSNKEEFWAIHGRQERLVQETHLCEEFERG